MNAAQWSFSARLVIYPARGPEGFGADAAFAALRYIPENGDLKQLWQRWSAMVCLTEAVAQVTSPTRLARHSRTIFVVGRRLRTLS